MTPMVAVIIEKLTLMVVSVSVPVAKTLIIIPVTVPETTVVIEVVITMLYQSDRNRRI
jgi:hypothetical protein